MKDSEKLILGIIIVYLVLCAFGGSFIPTQWSFVQKQPSGGLPPPTGAVGMFDMHTKGYNTLDVSTTYTTGTSGAYNLYWYAFRGGWILLGTNDQTVELTEFDGGYLYAVPKIASGQSIYVDWSETKAKNPRVESVSYEDVDNDGYKDFVFKINMGNIPKPTTGNPSLYFYPYFLAYEKPTISTPSDLTGLGTSKVTKYVEWYVYFTNAKKAFAITKIELVVNTTDTTKVTIKSVAVPGMGSISGDMFGSPLKGTNTLTWSYQIGSNLYNAHYITYPANVLNKFYFTNELDIDLDTGDVLSYTITIYGLNVDGSLTTLTDTVLLKAASS
jgi:hypothetical protein